jgi:hypothetical protein
VLLDLLVAARISSLLNSIPFLVGLPFGAISSASWPVSGGGVGGETGSFDVYNGLRL